MFKKILLLLTLLSALHAAAAAQFSDCRQFFAAQQIPVIADEATLSTRALCFSAFAVLHSGKSHTPLYVAEKLSRASVLAAKNNQRTDHFYADARLPQAERAELADYQGSGYDRGHMAPAGDMPDAQAMAQSFSLANMVPQAPQNNRQTWAAIEKATRKYVLRARGDVYVLSGPVFDPLPQHIGAGQVWVPHYLFKLVYDAEQHKAWAYWVENRDGAQAGAPISYQELVKRSGTRFLPGVM